MLVWVALVEVVALELLLLQLVACGIRAFPEPSTPSGSTVEFMQGRQSG